MEVVPEHQRQHDWACAQQAQHAASRQYCSVCSTGVRVVTSCLCQLFF